MKRPRWGWIVGLPDLPRGWNVPYWNTPAAQQFMREENAMKTAYEKLVKLEEEIDTLERQQVASELGELCEPGDARLAKARFESEDWQRTWQEFIAVVSEAQQVEQRWREEIKQTKG